MPEPVMTKSELIQQGISHLAKRRAEVQRREEAKKAAEVAYRLEVWKPHIEAIRAVLPPEAQDCIQEPISLYSRKAAGEPSDWYSAIEIKLGEISVFAWHYEPGAAKVAEVFFEPGHLDLDDEGAIYRRPSSWSRSRYQTEHMDFLYAVGLTWEDHERRYEELLATQRSKAEKIAKAPESTLEPTIGEQFEDFFGDLIRSIVRDELAEMSE